MAWTGVSGPDHDRTISLTSLCGPKISNFLKFPKISKWPKLVGLFVGGPVPVPCGVLE